MLYVCLCTLNYENECWLLYWLLKFNISHHATHLILYEDFRRGHADVDDAGDRMETHSITGLV